MFVLFCVFMVLWEVQDLKRIVLRLCYVELLCYLSLYLQHLLGA